MGTEHAGGRKKKKVVKPIGDLVVTGCPNYSQSHCRENSANRIMWEHLTPCIIAIIQVKTYKTLNFIANLYPLKIKELKWIKAVLPDSKRYSFKIHITKCRIILFGLQSILGCICCYVTHCITVTCNCPTLKLYFSGVPLFAVK